MFLVGALSVFIQPELRLSGAQVGATVSVFFGASALLSVWGGRLGDRLGSSRTMALAGLGSTVCLLGVALVVSSWASLIACAALGGAANGLVQPAANRALLRGVPRRHQGAAFGVKQAAIPLATLAGGSAVPLVGARMGWRWAFACGALLALPLGMLLARRLRGVPVTAPARARIEVRAGPLALLAVGTGAASATANAMATFLVAALVDRGWQPGAAGAVLAAGSVSAILVRVVAGWQADRSEDARPLVVVAGLMAAGAAGVALVGLAVGPVAVVAGVLVAFGAGWGWTGLLNFAVARLHPDAAGTATGITHAGQQAGAVVGPLAFGLLVDSAGYDTAWLVAVAAAVAAAALTLRSRVPLRRAVDDMARHA